MAPAWCPGGSQCGTQLPWEPPSHPAGGGAESAQVPLSRLEGTSEKQSTMTATLL